MVTDPSLSSSYYNLALDHQDFLRPSDQLLLLLHALGGSDIPDALLKAVRLSQRRFSEEGEVHSISAAQFELPVELIKLLSDDAILDQAAESPYMNKSALDDSTVTWSLQPEMKSFFSNALLPEVMNGLGVTVLKLLCFACPPCYEGNTHWYDSLPPAPSPSIATDHRSRQVSVSQRSGLVDHGVGRKYLQDTRLTPNSGT